MRKGQALELVPAGKVLGRRKANELIKFFNAFAKAKIKDGELLIGDLGIIFKISDNGAGGGRSGWRWAEPIELEDPPARSFSKGEVIHIQPTHSIVTTGMEDADSGDTVQSCAGFFVAIQDNPAPAGGAWNVPQDPLPNPLNIDDPLNFWMYLGEV